MTDQEKIKQLEAELTHLKREHKAALGAINMYRLTLKLAYDGCAPVDLVKAAMRSDLSSHLNGPLIEEIRKVAVELGTPDSFAQPAVIFSVDQMWDKFIYHYAHKYGHVTKPPKDKNKAKNFVPEVLMQNMIGSIEKFKREFVEANK